MPLINLPAYSNGSVLSPDHLNQIRSALQLGTIDIKTANLAATEMSLNEEDVINASRLESNVAGYTGHGYYESTASTETHPDAQIIPAGTRQLLSFTIDPTSTNERLPSIEVDSYWDDTNMSIRHNADYGEAILRITFKAKSAGRDKQILVGAQVPVNNDINNDPIIYAQTIGLSKNADRELDLSVPIPIWLDDFTKTNGIKIVLFNDSAELDTDSITIWNQKVVFMMTGGQIVYSA